MTPRSRLTFIIVSLMIVSLLLSLSKGSTSIPIEQLLFNENGTFHSIFFDLRLPRTLSAFVTGGLLALAGVLMQLLVLNPLADPYVLGVSGGAALFTLILMLMGASSAWLIGGAWGGSLFAILCLLLLARKHGWQTHALLLSGIAIACGFSACISLILILSPANHLHSMLFWLAGDLSEASFPYAGLAILIIATVIAMAITPALNLLTRGELEARALGLQSRRYRIVIYLLSSLCTATAVTIAGCIGFIGLIIPHGARLLVGHDHKFVVPVAIMLGGTLLTFADTLARTLFAPEQLPVGMVMALIGIPIFIWQLQP